MLSALAVTVPGIKSGSWLESLDMTWGSLKSNLNKGHYHFSVM